MNFVRSGCRRPRQPPSVNTYVRIRILDYIANIPETRVKTSMHSSHLDATAGKATCMLLPLQFAARDSGLPRSTRTERATARARLNPCERCEAACHEPACRWRMPRRRTPCRASRAARSRERRPEFSSRSTSSWPRRPPCRRRSAPGRVGSDADRGARSWLSENGSSAAAVRFFPRKEPGVDGHPPRRHR